MKISESARRLPLLMLVLLVGCDARAAWTPCLPGGGVAVPGTAAEVDSAGVSIIVTPCDLSEQVLGWGVATSPDLEIGQDEETGVHFAQIDGVAADANGRILVIERRPPELKRFSGAGDPGTVLGSAGDGPGELRGAVLVPTGSRDSVVLYDASNSRLTAWPAGGERYSSVRQVRWHPYRPLGLSGERVLLQYHLLRLDDAGMHWENPHLILSDLELSDPRVIQELEIEPDFSVVDNLGRRVSTPVPFTAGPSAALGPTGPLVTHGRAFEIQQFDSTGALSRILRIPRRRTPVTRELLAAYDELLRTAGRVSPWERYGTALPVADSVAAFSSLIVDDLGWIWARFQEWDFTRPPSWFVFDPEGRGHGRIELPAGLNVHAIGDTFVLGVWRDSLGVQSVRRHALRRE
jgi:hypothetical protein